jgi:hypothetical protein
MVGVSANGSSWTDVSGSSNTVEVAGGERATGAAYTLSGDVPIIKAGKRGPITVTVRGVYSETATELFASALAAYEATALYYVRWSPGGGDAGDFGYTCNGYVKSPPYPGGDGASGDPVLCELVIETAQVTKSTIGSAGW